MTHGRVSAFEYAVGLLSMREHSSAELRRKMRAKDYPSREIDGALAECRRLGYQDDRRFAAAMCEMLLNSGRGERLVRMKLRQKGIPPDLVEEALGARPEGQDDLHAAEIALAAREGSWVRIADPRKRREKMLRFLCGRGFQPSLSLGLIRRRERNGD